ncbi:MAG TPA: hypothetical protein IAD07_02740 [Candidatus Fimivicinus intestinavium]|nr:hypothetical protein [Candidatus Fimivicinus intestinavium]
MLMSVVASADQLAYDPLDEGSSFFFIFFSFLSFIKAGARSKPRSCFVSARKTRGGV